MGARPMGGQPVSLQECLFTSEKLNWRFGCASTAAWSCGNTSPLTRSGWWYSLHTPAFCKWTSLRRLKLQPSLYAGFLHASNKHCRTCCFRIDPGAMSFLPHFECVFFGAGK